MTVSLDWNNLSDCEVAIVDDESDNIEVLAETLEFALSLIVF
jgi:CheY-like chemotaxis protein